MHAPDPTQLEHPAAADTLEALRGAFVCAAQAVASSGDEDIFHVLVRGASQALDVDLAFIGVLADGYTDRIRTIAV